MRILNRGSLYRKRLDIVLELGRVVITVGIGVLALILYFTGQYVLAFWLIALSILSGSLALLKAVVNPNWYANERMKAGLEVDVFNPRKGIASLIVTKGILLTVLLLIAWRLADKAGYL